MKRKYYNYKFKPYNKNVITTYHFIIYNTKYGLIKCSLN